MKYTLIFILFLFSYNLLAQNNDITYAEGAFRGSRVVNGHSVETQEEGELEFLISHRFGRLNGGAYEFFGLDQAEIRLGLEYGIQDWLAVGAGRSSLGKHYDGFVKARLMRQSSNRSYLPLSITAFGSVVYKSLRARDPEQPILFQSRFSYTGQILIARQFGDYFSLQLMPTLVHYNLVETREDSNDLLSFGVASRVQITKNIAMTAEYYYTLPGQLPEGMHHPLAIGIDINTGSHVFQLHLSTSNGMIEKSFIGETSGDLRKGDIHLGFNISRIFKLKGRRY